jgi:tripartite-type tricarboxylate transporter receptor subunit TctC
LALDAERAKPVLGVYKVRHPAWKFGMKFVCAPFATLRGMVKVTLAFLILGAAATNAGAQSDYPNRPVRIITTFGAGGLADITARLIAEKLTQKFGQNFFIDNQPGAGGIAAARSMLSAPADGYTLSFITNATAISTALFEHLPYDPLKDFVPISLIGKFGCELVVSASSPLRSVADVIKFARDKPGQLNIGTVAVGSTQNLTAELFRSMANVDVVLVPFRTTPEEVVALLRDDIQIGIDFYAALKPSLDSGKLRPIATTGLERSAEFPNVSTVQEAGLTGFESGSWNSLYAPAGTPARVIATLNQGLREVLADPDLRRRALDLGIDPKPSSPADVEARMRSEIAKWSAVIERAHIPKQR